MNIMGVERQIISPQACKPIIGLVQDALLGSLLFTRKGVFLDRAQAMDLIAQTVHVVPGREHMVAKLPPPAILKPRPLWTGKQLYSLLIPTEINISKGTRQLEKWDPDDTSEERAVLIERGDLIIGSLCKHMVGTSSGGLVQVMFKDVGPSATKRFLSDAQKMVNRWLSWIGFQRGGEGLHVPVHGQGRDLMSSSGGPSSGSTTCAR